MDTPFVNYGDDLEKEGEVIKSTADRLRKEIDATNEESNDIKKLNREVNDLAHSQGKSEFVQPTETPPLDLDWDDSFFWQNNPYELDKVLSKEINRTGKIELTTVDYAVTGIAGVTAAVVDFFLVKIPKDMGAMSIYKGQKGSAITKILKGVGVDADGELNPFLKFLEKKCRVPFDKSIDPNIKGFGTRTHRLHSVGHDPLLGLIFGVLDILRGKMTVIDAAGKMRVLEGTFDLNLEDMVFAPFLWLGHIVSDVCTTAGIPIPGWAFTQFLQFGSLGEKNRNVAEISRWMYINGYDLRHFLTMSISTACVELVIRAYHYLSTVKTDEDLKKDLVSSFATKDLNRIQLNLKLHKMLFMGHSVATSGNAIKVLAYHLNPLAINLPQWIMFFKESFEIIQAGLRNKTGEKIINNRETIDKKWDEIKAIKLGPIPAKLSPAVK